MYLNERLGVSLPHCFKQLNKVGIIMPLWVNIRIYKHNVIRMSKNQLEVVFIGIYIAL